MKINKITPVFVKYIPSEVKEGILYIAPEYNSIIHKCACGCGEIISTPTDENGWTLTYKDCSVSLYPSIGNYSYKCKSHYFITKNKIIWVQPKPEIPTENRKIKWWKKIFRKIKVDT